MHAQGQTHTLLWIPKKEAHTPAILIIPDAYGKGGSSVVGCLQEKYPETQIGSSPDTFLKGTTQPDQLLSKKAAEY